MKRINSIDFVRGLVMVIMALDHIRDLMHTTSLTQNPVDLATTTTGLFLTRWITHLCAPIFVFLSGASAYISFKNSNNLTESKRFLLSRGIWLIVLEFTVINFALWFDIHFQILMMQVICAIGVGLVVLSFLLKFSPRNIGIAGLVIIFSHNLLQGISFPKNPALNFISSVLFAPNFFQITPNFSFLVSYPLIPWLGILLLGYGFGHFFAIPQEKRKKLFLQFGGGALLLFMLLRLINIYGDPAPWSVQKTPLFTILSFINVTKYPPSLLYTLVTLGIMFLVLSFTDGMKNKLIDIFSVYGKVPLFYYLIHWYLVHSIMIIMLFMQGFSIKDLNFAPFSFGRPQIGSGVELPVIYAVWLSVVIILYPLCLWYGKYKTEHRNNKWLRYL
ncbi:DUF1624 domain-containing protein [Emticicia sp. SJ17W-69]|uniref:DUF1624 domain-containing protein n=1 Tax=Emticicia sp. SJ17W-69 TaxID=3421657 RepID=UPI003EBA8EA1